MNHLSKEQKCLDGGLIAVITISNCVKFTFWLKHTSIRFIKNQLDTFSKFVDDTKLCAVGNTLKGLDARKT